MQGWDRKEAGHAGGGAERKQGMRPRGGTERRQGMQGWDRGSMACRGWD